MKPIVINLIGGPGCGKSTLAARLFAELKMKGVNTELINEFAKDETWDENWNVLNDQIYVFGIQYHKQKRLVGKVDIIITDSPLPLCIHYNKDNTLTHFNDIVLECFNQFDNYTYVLNRVDDYYSEVGRSQTLSESKTIDQDMLNILKDNNIPFRVINIGTEGLIEILKDLNYAI